MHHSTLLCPLRARGCHGRRHGANNHHLPVIAKICREIGIKKLIELPLIEAAALRHHQIIGGGIGIHS